MMCAVLQVRVVIMAFIQYGCRTYNEVKWIVVNVKGERRHQYKGAVKDDG